MARNTLTSTISVLTLMGAVTAPAMANIVNGGFEAGLAYSSGPNIFMAGTPAPWTPTSFTADMYDNTGVDGWGIGGIPAYTNMFKGMVAYQGNRFIGFAASTSFGGLNEAFAQTTTPLTPGKTYTLSAQLAADDMGNASSTFGGPYTGRGEVDVLLNGNFIGTLTQNTMSLTWESRSFSFVAPVASSYTFEFIAQLDPSAVGGGSSYVGLDDIVCVPTPGALAVLGLSGLIGVRRRRG
jgi:hypothetical protein